MVIVLYYLLDDLGKMKLEPRLEICKDFMDGVRVQNSLTRLGFKTQLLTIEEGKKWKNMYIST